jgi:hypothetical protein
MRSAVLLRQQSCVQAGSKLPRLGHDHQGDIRSGAVVTIRYPDTPHNGTLPENWCVPQTEPLRRGDLVALWMAGRREAVADDERRRTGK